MPRCSGSGSRRSTSITSTRTTRRCRWPTASARSKSCEGQGKIREIGLSQFTAERLDEALQVSERSGLHQAVRAADLVQHGRARQARGAAARRGAGARHGDPALLQPRQRLPDRQVPLGTTTSANRCAGLRNAEYLEGRGMRVLAALDEVAAETGAALATVDAWPGPWRSRASPRRSPARPASTNSRS